MFYIIDFSKPRRYIQNTYNDIALGFKLNPLKVNKNLVIASITLGIIFITGVTVNAVDVIDSAEYRHVIDYLVNERNYPREVAERIVSRFNDSEIQELVQNIKYSNQWDNFINTLAELKDHPIELIKNTVQDYLHQVFGRL